MERNLKKNQFFTQLPWCQDGAQGRVNFDSVRSATIHSNINRFQKVEISPWSKKGYVDYLESHAMSSVADSDLSVPNNSGAAAFFEISSLQLLRCGFAVRRRSHSKVVRDHNVASHQIAR